MSTVYELPILGLCVTGPRELLLLLMLSQFDLLLEKYNHRLLHLFVLSI